MISVAIVTASRALRTAWQVAVDEMPDAQCVGSYVSATALPPAANGPPVEIILLGVLPTDDGPCLFERTRVIRPSAQVLVLATGLIDEQFFTLLRAGAAGFLAAKGSPIRVQTAIRQVHQGETPLSKDATRRIVASFRMRPRSDKLSEREREVYRLLCRGKNYREIAESLFVSQNTVRFHLKNIYRKLGVKSRHEAVARAFATGSN